MNVSENGISIEIGASADKAINEIKKVSEKLKGLAESSKIKVKWDLKGPEDASIKEFTNVLERLKTAAETIGWANENISNLGKAMKEVNGARNSAKALEGFATGITTLAQAASSILPESLERLDQLMQSLSRLAGVDLRGISSALNAIGKEQAPPVDTGIFKGLFSRTQKDIQLTGQVATAVGKVITTAFRAGATAIKGIATAAKSAWEGLKIMGNAVSGVFSGIKDRLSEKLKPLTNLMNRIGRTVLLRAIRGAIKAVVNALKEGLEYAYKFSAGMSGESKRFATAMDSMSASTNKMKVQLGSAFISLLTALEPIISAVISLVTKLADALAQLFSAFTGSRYLKANNVAGTFADNMKKGAGSAKEWKNQLLGFDELNRLNEPSSGGGGGGASGIDASTAYTDSAISARIKNFTDTVKQLATGRLWSTLGTYLGKTLNSLIPSPEDSEELGRKIGGWIDGAFKTAVAFLKTADFGSIGATLASFLNGAIGSIDFYKIGEFLVLRFTSVLDFLGGALGTLDWDELGRKTGDFLRGSFDTASDWLVSKDWNNVGQNIFSKFKTTIAKIDFNSLADSFFHFLGTAFAAVMEFIDGFFHDTIEGIKNYFKERTEEMGGDVWEGFKKGISDAFKSVKEWCSEHIVKPFVQGIKDLLGIHSPSTVFESIGTNIIEGLFGGLSDAWSSVSTWISNTFGGLISWCQSAHNWLQDVLTGIGLVNSTPTRVQPLTRSTGIQEFAGGGFPAAGQLFVSRESGPELVGTMGGRTAVANNQEITDGIRDAVYDAMSAVMSQYGGSGDVHVYLDSREIRSGQTRLARAMG